VAIYRLLQNCEFGPDEIGRMTMAYEDALRVLGLANRTDPITEIVAKKIIEIVQTGERDPLHIRARAIADLRIPPLTLNQDDKSSGCNAKPFQATVNMKSRMADSEARSNHVRDGCR
jgi:hypothetical protein